MQVSNTFFYSVKSLPVGRVLIHLCSFVYLYSFSEKPAVAAPAAAAPAPVATPKAPASNDRLVALTDENNSLKRRIAELGHRQPAVEQQQSAPQAAYLILCIILGWLIAKYII